MYRLWAWVSLLLFPAAWGVVASFAQFDRHRDEFVLPLLVVSALSALVGAIASIRLALADGPRVRTAGAVASVAAVCFILTSALTLFISYVEF
jgi:hypothetical protein